MNHIYGDSVLQFSVIISHYRWCHYLGQNIPVEVLMLRTSSTPHPLRISLMYYQTILTNMNNTYMYTFFICFNKFKVGAYITRLQCHKQWVLTALNIFLGFRALNIYFIGARILNIFIGSKVQNIFKGPRYFHRF